MNFSLFSLCLFLILNQHLLFAIPIFNDLEYNKIRRDNLFNEVGFNESVGSICYKLDELQEVLGCNLKTSEEKKSENDDEDDDKNLIQPQFQYKMITACETIYKIKQGDTCESLAKKFGMENDAELSRERSNFIKYQFDDCNNLPIGKVICLVNSEKIAERYLNENNGFKDSYNIDNKLPQDDTKYDDDENIGDENNDDDDHEDNEDQNNNDDETNNNNDNNDDDNEDQNNNDYIDDDETNDNNDNSNDDLVEPKNEPIDGVIIHEKFYVEDEYDENDDQNNNNSETYNEDNSNDDIIEPIEPIDEDNSNDDIIEPIDEEIIDENDETDNDNDNSETDT